MESETAQVYQQVVENVVKKSSQIFINHCGNDSLLDVLQAKWELKMKMRGVVPGLAETCFVGTPDQVLNLPCDNLRGYQSPTHEMLFPPEERESVSEIPAVPDYKKAGKIAAYVNQPCRPWLNLKPVGSEEVGRKSNELMNASKMRNGKAQMVPQKRHFDQIRDIPQQDGPANTILDSDHPVLQKVSSTEGSSSEGIAENFVEEHMLVSRKNANDTSDKITGSYTPSYADLFPMTPNEPLLEENEDDEPPIDSNDEGSDEDDELDLLANTESLVLTKYQKVWRNKNRKGTTWKCNLKAGIIMVNDKEMVFSEAKGAFNFYSS